MTDESYLLDNKEKKSKKGIWIGRFLKLAFFLIAIFLILITILANMGGNSEERRQQVENMAGEIFYGRPARLETLKSLSFFPTSGIDLEGLKVYMTETSLVPFVSIGKFRIYMSFWAIATRTPYIKDIYVENARAIKGVFGPNEIFIEKIFIDDDPLNKSVKLKGNGKLGIHKWAFAFDVEAEPSGRSFKYRLKREFPFELALADVKITGNFKNEFGGAYIIKDLVIELEDTQMAGNIALSAPSENLMGVRGALAIKQKNEEAPANAVTLQLDTFINFANQPTKFTGTIEATNTKTDIIFGDDGALGIVKRIRDVLGYNAFEQNGIQIGSFLGPYDMDLNIALNQIDWLGADKDTQVTFPIIQESGNIRIGPISKNEEKITPAMMIVKSEDSTKRVALLSPGILSFEDLKTYLPQYDNSLIQQPDVINIECGLGSITYEGRTMRIDDIKIKTEKTGILGLNSVLLDKNQTLSNNNFVALDGFDFATTPLKAQTYDFIKPSLDNNQSISSCLSYFTRVEPPAPEPVEDQTTAEQQPDN